MLHAIKMCHFVNATFFNVPHYCKLDSYFFSSAASKLLNRIGFKMYEKTLFCSKSGVVLTPSGQMTLLQLDEERFWFTVHDPGGSHQFNTWICIIFNR